MKHLLTLLIGLFLVNATMQAQEPLTLTWEGEPIEGEITVFGSQFDAEIVAHAVVTNNTGQAMDVKVRRNRIEMQEGTMSQFCWGLCYPPSTDESPNFITIDAGGSSETEAFSGHYIPSGIWGASIIEYEFFNANNEEENVKVTVMFSATLAGFEDEKEVTFSMFPNPAMNQVTIDAKSRIEQLSIYDLTGKNVYSSSFEQTKAELNIEFLEGGIYLVRLETETGSVVKKLSVR